MIDVMEGVIEAVAAPKDIGYQDRKGNPATFTKYSFKMGNDLWYETTSANQALSLVRGEWIKFSFEETQKGDFTNRRIKDIFSELPENAPQTPEGSQSATQQGSQAQSVNWDRRALEIKWGQSVNLAAQYMDGPEIAESKWPGYVWEFAKVLFPMLIWWEKEAVDGMIEQPKLNEEGQREEELQNQSRLQEGNPVLDKLIEGARTPMNRGGGFAEPPEAPEDIQSYEDFRKAMVAANITDTMVNKFFNVRENEPASEAIESWMSIDGSLWHEAFAELQGSV